MSHAFVLYLNFCICPFQITCDGIRTAGPATIGLTFEDIQQLSTIDLFDCVESIGQLEWDDHTKVRILTHVVQQLPFKISSLPTANLIELGDLLTAIKVDQSQVPLPNGTAFNVPLDLTQMVFNVPLSLDKIAILGSKITDPPTVRI